MAAIPRMEEALDLHRNLQVRAAIRREELAALNATPMLREYVWRRDRTHASVSIGCGLGRMTVRPERPVGLSKAAQRAELMGLLKGAQTHGCVGRGSGGKSSGYGFN